MKFKLRAGTKYTLRLAPDGTAFYLGKSWWLFRKTVKVPLYAPVSALPLPQVSFPEGDQVGVDLHPKAGGPASGQDIPQGGG